MTRLKTVKEVFDSYTGCEDVVLDNIQSEGLLQTIRNDRATIAAVLKERLEGEKITHDIEKDPSGAFETCLICGDTTSDYCNIQINYALDQAIAIIDEVLTSEAKPE